MESPDETHEKLQKQLSDHQWETYLLARKLRAWAALIEGQTETELEGLGMLLREYSDVIYNVSRSFNWNLNRKLAGLEGQSAEKRLEAP